MGVTFSTMSTNRSTKIVTLTCLALSARALHPAALRRRLNAGNSAGSPRKKPTLHVAGHGLLPAKDQLHLTGDGNPLQTREDLLPSHLAGQTLRAPSQPSNPATSHVGDRVPSPTEHSMFEGIGKFPAQYLSDYDVLTECYTLREAVRKGVKSFNYFRHQITKLKRDELTLKKARFEKAAEEQRNSNASSSLAFIHSVLKDVERKQLDLRERGQELDLRVVKDALQFDLRLDLIEAKVKQKMLEDKIQCLRKNNYLDVTNLDWKKVVEDLRNTPCTSEFPERKAIIEACCLETWTRFQTVLDGAAKRLAAVDMFRSDPDWTKKQLKLFESMAWDKKKNFLRKCGCEYSYELDELLERANVMYPKFWEM